MRPIAALFRTGAAPAANATLRTFLRCQRGATAIEYALLSSLIAVTLVTAVALLGDTLATTFDTIGSVLPQSGNGGGPPPGSGNGNGNNGNGLGNGGPNG
jgi:pilus assembly protein Flp/PilA